MARRDSPLAIVGKLDSEMLGELYQAPLNIDPDFRPLGLSYLPLA